MKCFRKGKHYAKTQTRSHGTKGIFLSLVALVEVLAIMLISTYAWIESISSIKIYTKDNAKGVVEAALNQQVNLQANNSNDIDLTNYFRPSGGYQDRKSVV